MRERLLEWIVKYFEFQVFHYTIKPRKRTDVHHYFLILNDLYFKQTFFTLYSTFGKKDLHDLKNQ